MTHAVVRWDREYLSDGVTAWMPTTLHSGTEAECKAYVKKHKLSDGIDDDGTMQPYTHEIEELAT